MSKWSVPCPDRSAELPVHPDKVQQVPEQKAETVFSGLCADRWDLVREALTHRRYKRGGSHERIFTLKKQAAG